MIEYLTLRNFKGFEEARIPFGPMTILMGANGAGKSSVLQSLLLMRQSQIDMKLGEGHLNGDYVNLGVGRDILRQGSNEERISITIEVQDGDACDVEFIYRADSDILPSALIGALPVGLSGDSFQYLSAERNGPRLVSPRNLRLAEARQMGKAGEGALAVLEQYRAEVLHVDDPRRGGVNGSLEEIFQFYLSEICPTARIDLQPYGDVDSIGSSFTFTPPGGLPSLGMRPTNVGFGLSYALPIIVACLVARPGGLLIIENPEAHLHTVSQKRLAHLFYRTVQAGVQVVIETHSREFFHYYRNGAIENDFEGNLIRFNYIMAGYEDGARKSFCQSLPAADGSLKEWPQRFFEEYGSPLDLIAPVG